MLKKITNSFQESFNTIYPIIFIVFLINVFIPLGFINLILFLISSLFIIIGITTFNFGINISLISIGKSLATTLLKNKKISLILIISFIVGLVITIAEPDLIVLSNQLTNIPNILFISVVSSGVGLFLMLASYRILYKKDFNKIVISCYTLILIFLLFIPQEFIPIAFDASGATTGSISVPFILAFGLGLVSNRKDKKAKEDSFGLVGICSIGPIITVLLMGLFYKPNSTYTPSIENNTEVIKIITSALLKYSKEIFISLLPIIIILIIYQHKKQIYTPKKLKKISLGIFLTFIGLTLFLTGANVGYLKIAYNIGNKIVLSEYSNLFLPLGMIIGYFSVTAEPSVKILTEQIENITGGSISKKLINFCLSIGVAIAVLLSLTRVLTGISILYFIIPIYILVIILTLVTPKIFTVIAFDSGGAASGVMTTCFLLPLAIGAATSLEVNIIKSAFGMVALVAASPLLIIQILGLTYKIIKQRSIKKLKIDESIIEYKWGNSYGK